MPRTRQRVYVDTETPKNRWVFKKKEELPNESTATVVANVNNGEASSSQENLKDQKCKLKMSQVKETPKKSSKIQQKKKKTCSTTEDQQNYAEYDRMDSTEETLDLHPSANKAQFLENDQEMMMEVQENSEESSSEQDTDSNTDSDDDEHEVSFKNSQTTHDESDEGEYEDPSSLKKTTPSRKSTQERMQELDQEMQEKLIELEQLMTQGGLSGSARAVWERLLDRTSFRNNEGRNINQNSSKKIKRNIPEGVGDFGNDLNGSNSEETIYR